MHYLIDGYNLLYASNFEERDELIDFLIKKGISALIFFDGQKEDKKIQGSLEIHFTAKNVTADKAIIERATRLHIVITSDKELARICRCQRAEVMDPRAFLNKLFRIKKTGEEKPIEDSKRNIDRLLKIFKKDDPQG